MREGEYDDLEEEGRPRPVLSLSGDLEPQAPRGLLDAHQGNPDQTHIFGSAGRPILVAPGGIETVARVRADDPRAQSAVVSLSAPFALPTNTHIFAVVQWGTDGVTHQAVCDFIRGTQLAVAGSWIQVAGGNESSSISPVLLGASLAYGFSRGLAVVPTRTLRHANLVAPTSVTFDVPAYAVDVRYFRDPETSVCFLDFLSASAQRIYGQSLAANVSQEIAIPIAADCTQVRVRVVADSLGSGRLMFGLAL